jgi:hypothetical protein
MSRRERLHVDDGDVRQITRQRRGRLISCPNCMRIFESMRRFQLQCPQCGHAWQERSGRNVIDWLREQPANLAGGFIWVVPVLLLFGFFGTIVYSLAKDVDDLEDILAIAPIAAFLFILTAAIVVIGRLKHESNRF